jgi:hypothetical protein
MTMPCEQAAPGNGAAGLLFHVGRLGRAVPEQQRWAVIAYELD